MRSLIFIRAQPIAGGAQEISPGRKPGDPITKTHQHRRCGRFFLADTNSAHTNPHARENREGNCCANYSRIKAAVRTDAAPTNTSSPPRRQATQTPPGPGSLPSRGYPPNAPLSCNLLPTFRLFVFNYLTRRPVNFCPSNSTHLPSNSNTLHPSPRTSFPLLAHFAIPKNCHPACPPQEGSHPTRMREGSQRQLFLDLLVGMIRAYVERHGNFTRFLLSDRCYLFASDRLPITDS